jgi:hypothetical protein
MALRDPRNKSRNNASRRTSSSDRAKRSKTSAKYNPRPTSSASRANTKGSSNKVTTGKGGEIKSKRLRQALESVKTKRTSAKTPPKAKPQPKVKTNPASSTPRGAQGPRQAPVQGPYRKPPSAMKSATPKPKPKAPPKAATPKVSKVGPQIRQAKAVKAANPGRKVRATRQAARTAAARRIPAKGAALAGALYTAAQIAKSSGKPGAAKMSRLGIGGNAPVSKSNQPKRKSSNVGNYNTRDADGTIRNRKRVGPKMVGPGKVGAKKVGTAEQAFDKAYAQAKKAGKKSFTFDGKKYSTK